MKLTVEEHPESIERYRYVRPARPSRARACGVRCPGTARTCTLETGHRGPHVAHRGRRRVVAVWDEGAVRGEDAVPSPAGAPTVPRRRGPSGRPGPGLGVVEPIRRLAGAVVSSVESAIFFVLFLVFLGFAVHWLLLLL